MRKGTCAVDSASGSLVLHALTQQALRLVDYSQSRGFLHASSKSASGLPAHVNHAECFSETCTSSCSCLCSSSLILSDGHMCISTAYQDPAEALRARPLNVTDVELGP